MKSILKNIALLLIPVLLWFAFFVAFEPNNYFGIKKTASSTQPVARVRAYQNDPGTRLILGDSRLAHLDMDAVTAQDGAGWQNLAFGGASLQETLDLANWLLASGNQIDELLVEVSFYTLNQNYNTDRFAALEQTLNNPLAYCFNLEYNVNALTCFTDFLRRTPDTVESGDWTAADHIGDNGETIPLHKILYDYPSVIDARCRAWSLSDEFAGLERLAAACQQRGIRLTMVLPPMAENVLTETCAPYGIDTAMSDIVLPTLQKWAAQYGFTLLDYEWTNRPELDDDTQFYDGFHLDEKYGLPQWTAQLFGDMATAKSK